jgi:hypothetical protein
MVLDQILHNFDYPTAKKSEVHAAHPHREIQILGGSGVGLAENDDVGEGTGRARVS